MFRIATLALLAVIAIDLTDAACDPLPGGIDPIITGTIGSSPESAPDPCSDSCIPDCFCCSTTLAALPIFAVATLGQLPDVPASPAIQFAGGTSRAQDHVPKPLR